MIYLTPDWLFLGTTTKVLCSRPQGLKSLLDLLVRQRRRFKIARPLEHFLCCGNIASTYVCLCFVQ